MSYQQKPRICTKISPTIYLTITLRRLFRDFRDLVRVALQDYHDQFVKKTSYLVHFVIRAEPSTVVRLDRCSPSQRPKCFPFLRFPLTHDLRTHAPMSEDAAISLSRARTRKDV